MQVDFPFHVDARHRTAGTSHEDHVRDLIEQVLFTTPGERVNRPDFGSGLLQLVFDPNREELATATQLLVQGSLQHWLGDVIQVEDAEVTVADSQLRVTVRYQLIRTQERRVAQFAKKVE
jgi:phage baseplate assembly protein W